MAYLSVLSLFTFRLLQSWFALVRSNIDFFAIANSAPYNTNCNLDFFSLVYLAYKGHSQSSP